MPSVDEWFVSSGYVPSATLKDHPNNMRLADLPPMLRLLLATDGTVTKSLEAVFWEPVSVDLDQQAWVTQTPPWNSAGAKAAVLLDRQVYLVGQRTQHVYSFAKSYINTECMDRTLREGLLSKQLGIGELLRSFYYEQYRKVTDIGWHSMQPCSQNPILAQSCVYRTYTVTSQRQTLMQITEYFPIQLFLSPTQGHVRPIQPY